MLLNGGPTRQRRRFSDYSQSSEPLSFELSLLISFTKGQLITMGCFALQVAHQGRQKAPWSCLVMIHVGGHTYNHQLQAAAWFLCVCVRPGPFNMSQSPHHHLPTHTHSQLLWIVVVDAQGAFTLWQASLAYAAAC